MRAAALTYNFILSLIPALAVCLSALSLFFDVRKYTNDFKHILLNHLAAGSKANVAAYVDAYLISVRFKTIGTVGVFALLITALMLLSNIEDSINHIWSIRRKKKFWKRFLIYNLILLFGPVSVSISVATTTVVANYFPELLINAHLGIILLNTTLFTLTYKVFPNEKVFWLAALAAGATTACAIEVAKWGYANYTAKAIFYNNIYGGLAALPVFLVWIYVNWILFLAGALLSYMIQYHVFRNQEKKFHA